MGPMAAVNVVVMVCVLRVLQAHPSVTCAFHCHTVVERDEHHPRCSAARPNVARRKETQHTGQRGAAHSAAGPLGLPCWQP